MLGKDKTDFALLEVLVICFHVMEKGTKMMTWREIS